MPLQQTSGAASYDAFGGGTAVAPLYIENFFQSYLRTGTGASATVTTGLDGSTKETLVWTKSRSAATNHKLTDNVRGVTKALSSNTTDAEATDSQGLTAFSATGYTLGTNTDYNNSGATYVDWQWVAQPKFFDVVTYTGTGSNTTIAHSLGAVPGSIIVKRTDTTAAWAVYHRSLANTQYLVLNTTAAAATGATWWNSTTPTSTVFSVGTDASVNASGGTYVAYLFAHDAGGFGLTGTDNVISCGSFTTDGSGQATVSLGWEPQFFMRKNIASGQWTAFDSMRAMPATVNKAAYLLWSASVAESADENGPLPTAVGASLTGFAASETYIYIAIRRGPMKVPTLGTSVYNAIARTGTGAAATITGVGFPPDLVLYRNRTVPKNTGAADRLRGANLYLATSSTAAEGSIATMVTAFNMDGISVGNEDWINTLSDTFINWFFKRAPGFFDEVCYTGNNTARTINHNLGVVPEMMIFKNRTDASTGWITALTVGGLSWTSGNFLRLELTNGTLTNTAVLDTTPTATLFSIPSTNTLNYNASNYVAYLFATCAGVSKVGSYTGNGSSQTINCGFTGGARFVLIKRTDAAGDWYVWDSARGIVAGNDPHLSLNTTAAEVTTDDSVDTDSTGFVVNQLSATDINVTSAAYIFLSVA